MTAYLWMAFASAMLLSALQGPKAEHRFQTNITVQLGALDNLGFLVGRWSGQGPDGSTFYEEYDFGPDGSFRSRRFEDGTFSVSTDGSSVEQYGHEILSKWGPYTWRATRLERGLAEFEPVSAPSSFSWRRLDADHVEVSQHWVDEAGDPQGYKLILSRLPGGQH